MTTKQKFSVESPEVVVLRNGRYAYKAECPWQGKDGRKLVAFKFCPASEYERFVTSMSEKKEQESSDDE